MLVIDIDRAVLLHNLGLSWDSIAKAMNVTRQTLYNHLDKAGLASARPEHTAITDEELDAKITEIAHDHPFIGSSIAMGHLQSRWNIHVPIKHVQDSFRRVDACGVLLR